LENKSKFGSLKRILPILLITLLAAFSIRAQETRNPDPGAFGKVVKLYPNPATTYIVFDLQKSNQKGLSIVVYNFLGKKMYETQNVSEKTTVTLTDFARGVYIYHLTDQSGKVIDTGKFQVAR
jgi:hypothetical protein